MHISYFKDTKNPQTVMEFLDKQLPKDNSTRINYLILSHSEITSKNLPNILNKLKNYNIRNLDLSYNDLGDNDADLIATALKASNIQKAILRGNDIGDKGAIAIAKAIESRKKSGTNLELDLTKNRIGPAGGVALLQAIIDTDAKEFDLSENRLGDNGAEAIARVLENNHGQVTQLVLTYNDIGDKGDKELAECVPKNIAIKYRVKQVPFTEKHPILSFLLFFLILPIFFLPFMKADVPVDGCKHEEKRKPSQ